ncbi:hypothetical protein DFP72DRAFT_888876 [Ephemerocybe angulata]|uniref:Uncharacterized protein n=1 Tax=Ephemerocybe angulata TaxID=980116 RepID=A0A8H6I476_9AGAR|nr:hypothetical protein DFP72DRAFT_888807 [Tulosesus angulatus]KAF6758324.1 hypothetical protein DFP72DRAFT_888876 [Tulosesus angulatus]
MRGEHPIFVPRLCAIALARVVLCCLCRIAANSYAAGFAGIGFVLMRCVLVVQRCLDRSSASGSRPAAELVEP